jgi:hypothetical protein
MPQPNRILLLDDGELSNVARILEALGLKHTRIRGQQVVGKLAPPSELLITTPRCADLVRRGSPPDAPPGRPVRIVGAQESSNSMRRKVRRMGYDLLVGLPGKDEIWQPLIHRATYHGQERRDAARVVVGSKVSLKPDSMESQLLEGTLMDISSLSCRLLVPKKFEEQTRLALTLPEAITSRRPLTLDGRVTRTSRRPDDEYSTLTLTFDQPMDVDIRAELNGVVNFWSVGPPTGESDPDAAPRPQMSIAIDQNLQASSIPVESDSAAPLSVPVTAKETGPTE